MGKADSNGSCSETHTTSHRTTAPRCVVEGCNGSGCDSYDWMLAAWLAARLVGQRRKNLLAAARCCRSWEELAQPSLAQRCMTSLANGQAGRRAGRFSSNEMISEPIQMLYMIWKKRSDTSCKSSIRKYSAERWFSARNSLQLNVL